MLKEQQAQQAQQIQQSQQHSNGEHSQVATPKSRDLRAKRAKLRFKGLSEDLRPLATALKEKGRQVVSEKYDDANHIISFLTNCFNSEHGGDGDQNPSCSVYLVDGQPHVHCFAGCDAKVVWEHFKELMVELGFVEKGCTIDDLCGGDTGLRETLVWLGVGEREILLDDKTITVVSFPYTTSDGRVFHQYRVAVSGKGKYLMERGAPATDMLFGVGQALESIQQGAKVVFITESPMDAATLCYLGFPAISVAGKNTVQPISRLSKLIPEDVIVVAWCEPDAPAFAREVSQVLQRPVFAIHTTNPNLKDAYRILQAKGDPNEARKTILSLIESGYGVVSGSLSQLLWEIESIFRRFVVLDDHYYPILALWVAHTYCYLEFDYSPYLVISSAEKRSGKTLLCKIISKLSNNGEIFTNPSIATIFRLIEKANQSKKGITCVFDEVDNWLRSAKTQDERNEIISIFNAGFEKSVTVPRCVPPKFEPVRFNIFSPKVFSGITLLQDTLQDRSIPVVIRRKMPHEEVEMFITAWLEPQIAGLRGMLGSYFNQTQVRDAIRELYHDRSIYKEMPECLTDRERNILAPLWVIAKFAGDNWIDRLEHTLRKIFSRREDNLSTTEQIIKTLRDIVVELKLDEDPTALLETEVILSYWMDCDDVPTPEDWERMVETYHRASSKGEKELKGSIIRRFGRWLAKKLKMHGISPSRNNQCRGYRVTDILEAYDRWVKEKDVPEDEPDGDPTAQSLNLSQSQPLPQLPTPKDVLAQLERLVTLLGENVTKTTPQNPSKIRHGDVSVVCDIIREKGEGERGEEREQEQSQPSPSPSLSLSPEKTSPMSPSAQNPNKNWENCGDIMGDIMVTYVGENVTRATTGDTETPQPTGQISHNTSQVASLEDNNREGEPVMGKPTVPIAPKRPPACIRCGSTDTVILPDHTTVVCCTCGEGFKLERDILKRVLPHCPYCGEPLKKNDRLGCWVCEQCRVRAGLHKSHWKIQLPNNKSMPSFCCVCGEGLCYVPTEELWECPRCGSVHKQVDAIQPMCHVCQDTLSKVDTNLWKCSLHGNSLKYSDGLGYVYSVVVGDIPTGCPLCGRELENRECKHCNLVVDEMTFPDDDGGGSGSGSGEFGAQPISTGDIANEKCKTAQNTPQNGGFSQENGDVLDDVGDLGLGTDLGHGDVDVVDLDDVFGFKQGVVTKPLVETQSPRPSVKPTETKPSGDEAGDWGLGTGDEGDEVGDLGLGTGDEGNYVPPSQPKMSNNFILLTLPDGTIRFTAGDEQIVVNPQRLRDGAKPIDEIEDLNIQIPQTILHKQPTLVFDIETNPHTGEIIGAGLMFFHSLHVERYLWLNTSFQEHWKTTREDILYGMFDGFTVFYTRSEKALIEAFIKALTRYVERSGAGLVIVGYNITGFDFPHIIERAQRLGINLPFDWERDVDGNPKVVTVPNTAGIVGSEPIKFTPIRWKLSHQPQVVDVFHLVARYDSVNREMRHHDLKSVALHFGVNEQNRPELSPDQILEAFHKDGEKFNRYLICDLWECYRVYQKLAVPYFYITQIVNAIIKAEGEKVKPITFSQATTLSTAAIVERLLESHYGFKTLPTPDRKVSYKGGLVVCRKGVYYNAAKLDVASLYPSIMLAYRIHSRKDVDGWMLKVLKWLTKKRLEFKAQAKEKKDAEAENIQQALKILINSIYGFYGTGGYPYNDMDAAASVTHYGRELLILIISTIEGMGGVVAEADTDGVIFSHPDPAQVEKAVNDALPTGFKVELEFSNASVFVSDRKNYIVLLPSGELIQKGAKWRGRDNPAFVTQDLIHYIRLYLEGKPDEAENYITEVERAIREGGRAGWEKVCVTRKVGKNDKFLMAYGKKVGELVTYAYKDKNKGAVSFSPEEGYNVQNYLQDFRKKLGEVRQVLALKTGLEVGETKPVYAQSHSL